MRDEADAPEKPRERRVAGLTSEKQKEGLRSDAAHQVSNPDQDDCTNRRYDQGTDHPLGPCYFQLREDPSPDDAADEHQDQVPNKAVAGAPHQLARKPAGENSDYDCSNHEVSRVCALAPGRMMHASALERQ